MSGMTPLWILLGRRPRRAPIPIALAKSKPYPGLQLNGETAKRRLRRP